MKYKVMLLAVFVVAGTLALYGRDITGKVSVSGVSVVWVDAIPGKTFPAPGKSVVMDQKGLMFQPHVLVIEQGTTVEFLNSDKVAHNVFWTAISGNKKLGSNLGTWPTGQKKPFKFDNPGVAPLLCNVHPEMFAYIVIAPTPYFAETDASGNYKITGVPDGAVSVTAWHEGYKQQTKPVAATVDFTLTK